MPGGWCIFQKGGVTITDKKNQLVSPVAMGDNGHWQSWSRLPAYIMAGEFKLSETNLKSEKIINFYLVFLQILMRLWSKLPCFVVIFFISRKRYSIGEVLKLIFYLNPGTAKLLGGCKTQKYELCKGWEEGGGGGGGGWIFRGQLYG